MLFFSAHETWGTLFILWTVGVIFRRKSKGMFLILSLLCSIGIADLISFQILKPTIGRYRPCYTLSDVNVVQKKCGGDYGFPSNHSANAGATLGFIYMNVGRTVFFWIACGTAFIVAFSRVYLGVHYPFDVLGGLLLGSVIGILGGKILKLTSKVE